MIIIEKEIENKNVVLEVDETIDSTKLGGQPLLKVNGRFIAVIYAVDTLTVIKGIANADTLNDIVESMRGTWAEDSVKEAMGVRFEKWLNDC